MLYYILHIYYIIYIRQGEEVPREDVNQDHWIGEKTVFHCGKMEILHVVLFIVDVFQLRINFFSSVEVEVNYGPSQYVFLGVLIFSIGITRCTFCAISKIIGKGYNILCFHRYFDVMLFFIGNSQWFCISSKFPSAVSQLFFLFLYKSISTRHINHYRRHKPDQFKCYSMQEDTIVEH